MKMRKLFALMMVAVLSLTIALAVAGCGKKTETETTMPPVESSMPADSSAMMDSMGHMVPDTSMHQ